MPDLRNFSVTSSGSAQVIVPRWTIAGEIVESRPGGAVLADFTGPNAIQFPSVLATLSVEQRQEIIDSLATKILLMKGGFE